jgi:hypothetical protein
MTTNKLTDTTTDVHQREPRRRQWHPANEKRCLGRSHECHLVANQRHSDGWILVEESKREDSLYRAGSEPRLSH